MIQWIKRESALLMSCDFYVYSYVETISDHWKYRKISSYIKTTTVWINFVIN